MNEDFYSLLPSVHFKLNQDHANIIYRFDIDKDTDVVEEEGMFTDGNRIFATDEPGYAIYGPIVLTHLEDYGYIDISWVGNPRVEVSYDYQDTWSVVGLDGLPNFYQSISNTTLYIKISLDPGQEVSSLSLLVYDNPPKIFAWGVPETHLEIYGSVDVPTHEFNFKNPDHLGIVMDETDYIRVVELPDERKIYALELWFKTWSMGTSVVSAGDLLIRNGYAIEGWDSLYVDGVQQASLNITDNDWHSLCAISNAGVGTDILINRNKTLGNGGSLSIGSITLHEYIPSAAEIADSYLYVKGLPNLTVSEGIMTLTDDSVKIVDVYWSNITPTQ